MELREYQRAAVDAVWEHIRTRDDNPCVVLPTGCHALDHPILMHDGRIQKVQDIRVGDLLMGDDSTPRTVLALCRGREPLYRIIPRRGPSFVVNAGHVLSLVSTNEGKQQFKCYQTGGEITNIPLREYLEKAKSWKHLRKLYHVPVDFPNTTDLPMPPYILGLLLGDGSLVNETSLTTVDEELAEVFIQYADSVECDIRVNENTSGVPTYHLIGRKGIYNLPMDVLEALGLRGHIANHLNTIRIDYMRKYRTVGE